MLKFGDVLYRPMLQYAGHKNFILTTLVREYEQSYFDGEVIVSTDALRQTWKDPVGDLNKKVFTDRSKAEWALEELKRTQIHIVRVDSEQFMHQSEDVYYANTVNKAKNFIVHHEENNIPIERIELGIIDYEYRADGGSIDDFVRWLKETNRKYKVTTIYAEDTYSVIGKIKVRKDDNK